MKLKTILSIAWLVSLILTTIVIVHIYKKQLAQNKRILTLEEVAKKYGHKTDYNYK